LTETLRPKRGRPKGAKGDADDELDILIQRRRETQEQAQREAAHARARYALRKQNERQANRLAWVEYHDGQAHRHLTLAREHFAHKTRLAREEIA